MPQFGGASEKCVVCSKTVYLVEKIVVEDKEEKKTFHKGCLKCTHCNVKLSLGNYASMKGVMYCKPHFKQLFATKGNYDEGFGKEKHTTKWTPNAPPAASTAGSFVPVEKTDEVKSPEKKDTPSSIASKFQKTSFNSERCEKCNKIVYATEKIVVEEKEGKKVYHKGCLRCVHCQVVLTLGNYAAMNGITYCKPHFKQLFATKGNYDEGFGKEKHTTKWDPQSNAAPATFVPVEKTDSKTDNKAPAPSEVAKKFSGVSASGSDKCTACGKTVYLTEKTVVEDKEDKKVFHKACLRCTHCQVVLSLGNYASMGGVMYCKPHFKQLFASKGNYDEGFGKQKHTAKWIDQDEQGDEHKYEPSPKEESPRVELDHHAPVHHTPAHHEEPKEQEHHHHEEEKHKPAEPEHHTEQHHSTVHDHHEVPSPPNRDDSSDSSDEDAKERRREQEELERERERHDRDHDHDHDHHHDRDSRSSSEDD